MTKFFLELRNAQEPLEKGSLRTSDGPQSGSCSTDWRWYPAHDGRWLLTAISIQSNGARRFAKPFIQLRRWCSEATFQISSFHFISTQNYSELLPPFPPFCQMADKWPRHNPLLTPQPQKCLEFLAALGPAASCRAPLLHPKSAAKPRPPPPPPPSLSKALPPLRPGPTDRHPSRRDPRRTEGH